jgi:hypothetical protein
MPYRAGFRIHPLGKGESVVATATEAAHGLLHLLVWLLRNGSDEGRALPVRVFYKFDSGGWRWRSTRQLQKVYRCR